MSSKFIDDRQNACLFIGSIKEEEKKRPRSPVYTAEEGRPPEFATPAARLQWGLPSTARNTDRQKHTGSAGAAPAPRPPVLFPAVHSALRAYAGILHIPSSSHKLILERLPKLFQRFFSTPVT